MTKWWGVGDHKLKQLIKEAPRFAAYGSELETLLASSAYDCCLFAAYEWISANCAIEQAKEGLGLHDLDYMLIRYEDLVHDPVGRLRDVNRWMGLTEPCTEFYETAERRVQVRKQPRTQQLALAGWIRDDFTKTMQRYGYGSTKIADGRNTDRQAVDRAERRP